MKKIIFLFFCLCLVFIIANVSALPNPAAVYCTELGYVYKIVETPKGEKGICEMPNKQKCEEWSFFRGECGQEFSYCARHGYEIKSKKGMTFCVVPVEEAGRKTFKEIPVSELLNLTKSSKCNYMIQNQIQNSNEEVESSINVPRENLGTPLPSYWDWRDPPNGTLYSRYNFTFFDELNGWVTSVKNQGYCGSCWAFATIGALEAKHEINQKNSRLNPDLSEEYLVSNCSSAGDCCGGYLNLALSFIKSQGVSDENCFPYVDSNCECEWCNSNVVCSNRCTDYAQRLWKIDSYTLERSSSNSRIKQLLVTQGPLIAAMGIYYEEPYGRFDENGIYRCENDSYLNHAVLIVGYNDTGNISTSYWIIKNSWGTGWGEGGYFKLGFNECGINSYLWYINKAIAPTSFKPKIILNYPPNNYTTTIKAPIPFNFTIITRTSTNAICDLIINNSIVDTTTSTNNTPTTIDYIFLKEGTYNWKIQCWEQDIGIVNVSATRLLSVGTGSPVVILNQPQDNYTTSSFNVIFNCAASDNSDLANVTLYGNWSSGWHASETNSSPKNATPVIFEKTLVPGVYVWNCQACDTDGNCAFASQNRTLTVPYGCVTEDGTIFTCGDRITQSCTLNGNLQSNGTCFTIGANNVIINGNGHHIVGNGTGDGINTNGQGNITIFNLTISNFSTGINISNLLESGNLNINNCIIQDNSQQDIGFYKLSESNCDHIFIENVNGSGDRTIGFYNESVSLSDKVFSQLILCDADGSSLNNVKIKGSEILKNNGLFVYFTQNSNFFSVNSSENYYGIYLYGSGYNIINNSFFEFNNQFGIYIGCPPSSSCCDSNNVSNNSIQENTLIDLFFDVFNSLSFSDFCRNVIQDNIGSGNRSIGFYNEGVNLSNQTFSQLILCDANGSTLTNVTIMGSDTLKNNGLFILETNNATLNLINSSNNFIGITLVSSEIESNNNITNSYFNSNYYGIIIGGSSKNKIFNITANSNELYGLYLLATKENYILQSKFNSNSYGIHVESNFSIDNTFMNNEAKNNRFFSFEQSNGAIAKVDNLDIGLSRAISFESKNVRINKTTSPARDPSNYRNINKFIRVISSGSESWISLRIYYNENELLTTNESSLRMFIYNGSWVGLSESEVNVNENYVYSGNVSITHEAVFAPMYYYSSAGGGGGGGAGGGPAAGGIIIGGNITNQTNVTLPQLPSREEKREENKTEETKKPAAGQPEQIKKLAFPRYLILLLTIIILIIIFVLLRKKKKKRKIY